MSLALTSMPLDTVLSLETTAVIVLLTGMFKYYTFGHYLILFFSLMATTLALTGLWKFVGSIARDIASAGPINGVLIVVMVVFTGFVITYDAIPEGWLFAYWLNPLAWGFRNISLNHFHTSGYTEEQGSRYLANVGMARFDNGPEWIIYGFIFLACFGFFFHSLSVLAYENLRLKGRPAEVAIPDEYLDEFTRKVDVYHESTPELALPFQKTVVTFSNLSYFVPHPSEKGESLQLLRKVNGFASPGRMVALMGESGAGKTTLMDVVAGRKTLGKGSYITGEILFNGYKIPQRVLSRILGYVEQNDIHTPTATVQEALEFSAALRLPREVSDEQRATFVKQILELLDLTNLANSLIGDPAVGDGISTEQRKRLTCGVELAANPAVLFLDEPTSGLDSRAAQIVMKALRSIAATGRTVICTIHQPSTEIFNLFDDLLLLKRGGQVVYFDELGEHSSKLISYFSSFPDAPRLQPNVNPADWMLNVLNAVHKNEENPLEGHVMHPLDVEEKDSKEPDQDKAVTEDHALRYEPAQHKAVAEDYALRYLKSQMFVENEEKLQGWMQIQEGVLPPDPKEVAMATFSSQLPVVLKKAWLHTWRSPTYTFTRFAFYIFCALFYGTVFIKLPFDNMPGVQSRTGFVYSSTSFSGLVAFNTVVPVISQMRVVYYREKASRTYNVTPFSLALSLTEIPYVLASSLVFVAIIWPLVPLSVNKPRSNFAFYWLVMFVYTLMQVYLGQLFAIAFSTDKTAATIGAGVMMIWNLFSGYLVPFPDITPGWRWLYWLSGTHYAIESLQIDQFYCPYWENPSCPQMTVPVGTSPSDPMATTMYVWEFVESTFGFNPDMKYWNVLILFIFTVVFMGGRSYCLAYVSYLQR
eukprot:gb/GEZN01001544.1/.p1 GENE.gb/GEZN01001544.1/~~gb/GEZN01001544.1/.p1  ORF type:complete len:902 (+),score=105.86 gb/GEZN01001544.1/:99-2708(+)